MKINFVYERKFFIQIYTNSWVHASCMKNTTIVGINSVAISRTQWRNGTVEDQKNCARGTSMHKAVKYPNT